jgi:tetratricopeptide (TPR) repeat protein
LFAFPFIAAHLARAYALAGRRDEAVALLQQAVERSAAGVKVGLPLWTAWVAECHLAEGRTTEAAELAGRALERARLHAEAGHEAWILRLLGDIAASTSPADLERAAAHYRAALVKATDLGMRPLVAHCHVGLGRIEAAQGNRARAAEHLDTATEMYRAMKMDYWLTRATAGAR